jgi:hypothetical protein
MADDDEKTTTKRPARTRAGRTITAADTAPADLEEQPTADTTDTAEASGEDSGGTMAVMTEQATPGDTDLGDGDEDAGDEAAALPVERRLLGADQLGYLSVSYTSRNVNYVVDGSCAARVMAVFAGNLSRHAQDLMLPGVADMNNLWVTLSLDDVLGMSWMPGLPSAQPRTMTVDPPPPAGE